VDGPRGPVGSFAPGALIISQRTGAPIIPVGARTTSAWRLRSWDRFLIPKPFASVTVSYGELIWPAAMSARDAAEGVVAAREALEPTAGAAGAEVGVGVGVGGAGGAGGG